MPTVQGPWRALKTLSAGVTDQATRSALRELEEHIRILMARLADLEARVTAGSL